MKTKIIHIVFLMLAISLKGMAQTVNVTIGETTYQIPASKAGDMPYHSASVLTIMGKDFSLDDIGQITIDQSEVKENQVGIKYDGNTAAVTIPYNLMSHLTVDANGSHVSILQDDEVSEEVTYTLSGASDNGSFYMDGNLKASVVLNGVTLTNPDGAAINIRNGKRIAVVLANGTTNTLADGKNGSQKGCFAVKGHTEFDGGGTLNITGNTAHGFWGKEYVQLKKGAGVINILGAVSDGFNVNQYFQQNGGTVTIKNVGDDGIQVSFKTDDNEQVIPISEDEDNTGEVVVKGGTLDITVTAAGAKGVKAAGPVTINEEKSTATITIKTTGGTVVDGSDYTRSVALKSDKSITFDAGTVNATCTGQGAIAIYSEGTLAINGGTISGRSEGSNYGNSGGGWGPGGGGGWGPGGGGGWPGGGGSSNSKNAKGVKSKGAMTITGGTLNAYSANHEGLESKGTMDITGGVIYVQAKDDAINSSSNMTINGGNIYAYSTSNDGLDSNGNMYVNGGVAIAFGGGGAETGIDIDERHYLTITGGQLFGIGGRTDSHYNGCTQSYGYTSSNANCSSTSGYYVLSQGTTRLFAVKVPKSYNGIVLCSSPSMVKGTSYTIGSSTSVSGEEVNGFIENPTVESVSGTVSFSGR